MADMAATIRRSSAAIESQSRQTAKRMSADEKASAKERVAAERAAEREISAIMRRQESDGRRASAAIARDRIRDIKNIEREEARAARASQRERERFASRTSQRFTRFLFPRPEGMLGFGKRVGTDMLRGLGYDLSMSSAIERVRGQRESAMGISQQERIATGKSRGTAFYQGAAEKTGGLLSMDPEQISHMTRAFTGLTGEFDEAVKIQERLASIGGASGASLEHIGEAAGNIYNAFRGMPDAGNATIEVLRGVVHQTASGAIEMKDYALRIGQVAALARRMPGDTAKNIMSLSALTQFSILGGGGNINAANAATSMRGIMGALTQKKRIAAIEKLTGGYKVYNKEGQLNDVMGLMMAMVSGSKGDIRKMSNAIPNVRANAIFMALANTYNGAGGGAKGDAAMKGELGKLIGHPMTAEQERANNAEHIAFSGAQRFKNAMDTVAKDVMGKLEPAAEKLAPTLVSLASKAGRLAAFFTDHWALGIASAIGIAITRAFVESQLRQGIDRVLAGRPGAGPGGMTGGALPRGGTMTNLGAIVIGAEVGAAISAAIIALADKRLENKTKTLEDTKDDEGLYGPAAKKRAEKLKGELRDQLGADFGDDSDNTFVKGSKRFWTGLKYVTGTSDVEDIQVKRQRIRNLEGRAGWEDHSAEGLHFGKSFERDALVRAKKDAASVNPADIGNATAAALRNTTIPVRVTNPQPPGGGSPPGGANVDPGGRQPPVGQRHAA